MFAEAISRLSPRSPRLQSAAAKILGDRRLLWGIVGLVAVQRVLADLPVFLPSAADAYAFIDAGRQALSNPGGIYAHSAAEIAAGRTWVITWPPPQIVIAIPFTALPPPVDVWVWVGTNALMAVAGLVLLYRAIAPPRATWTLPITALVVLCFTPLFEDIRLGQRGGLLLLLAGGAMFSVRRHPAWAGVLTGLGTSIKFYPAAMALSIAPRQWLRFTIALVATATAALLATFIPFGSPIQYLTKVLIPVSVGNAAATRDCFQNSTPLLFSRLVGGANFSMINSSGVWKEVTLVPWHLPWLAQLLTYLTIATLFGATVWAAWRSGWAQPYSMSAAFALGALVPGDVYTYQFIPMLPLTLVLVLKAIEQHRWGIAALAGAAELVLISSPCALVFPGLWTIAGLAIFGVAVTQAALFRDRALR